MYQDFHQDKDEDKGVIYNGPDPGIGEPLVVLSVVNTFFDYISGILVNLLIILIPYYWYLCMIIYIGLITAY